jgi:hypothetical protein
MKSLGFIWHYIILFCFAFLFYLKRVEILRKTEPYINYLIDYILLALFFSNLIIAVCLIFKDIVIL